MVNAIYTSLPTTIFTVMSGLARELGAINLGQGFPDEPGPEVIRRAAAEAVLHGDNQYPPMAGLPALREAAAATIGASRVSISIGRARSLSPPARPRPWPAPSWP